MSDFNTDSNGVETLAVAATGEAGVAINANFATISALITSLNAAITTANGLITSLQSTRLIKANNLSDVVSATTSRANLGLGSAATHASTDFDAAGTAASKLSLTGGTMSGPIHMGGSSIDSVSSLVTTFSPSLTAPTFSPIVGYTEWFVKTTGNDSTGDGTTGNPFLTIGKALTVAVSNDTITVGPGTFALGNSNIDLKGDGINGVNLRGAGSGSTTITSTFVLTSGAIIHPGNNSYIGGFTLNGVASSTTFQAPIGSRSGSSQDGFTNVTVNDVTINAGSDGFYVISSELITMNVYNTVVNSHFDCNNLDLIVGSIVNFYNCTFTATGPWAGTSPGTARGLAVASGGGDFGGRVNAYNCTIIASNGSSVTYACENSGCELWLFNCTLSSSTGGTVWDILTQGTTPGLTYAYNTTGSGGGGSINSNITVLGVSASADIVALSGYYKSLKAETPTFDYLTINHNLTLVGNQNGTGNIMLPGDVTGNAFNGSLSPDSSSAIFADGEGNLSVIGASLTLNQPLDLNAFALNFDEVASIVADGSGDLTFVGSFLALEFPIVSLQGTGAIYVNNNQSILLNGGVIRFGNGTGALDLNGAGPGGSSNQLPVVNANIGQIPSNQSTPVAWWNASINGQTYFIPLYQ